MSKTIFISQPMGGLSDEQVLQERTAAISKAKALLGEDVAPLETFFDDFGPAAKPLDYLARAADVSRRRVEKDLNLMLEHRVPCKGRCGNFRTWLEECPRLPYRTPVRRGLWHPGDGGVTDGELFDF